MARTKLLKPEPIRWVVLAPIIAALMMFVPIPTWMVDTFYSRDMYPGLQYGVTTATNLLPFALVDLWLALAALMVLYRLRRLYLVARQRGVVEALWEGVRRIVRATAVLAILFYWIWGFNYHRIPLSEAVTGGVTERLTLPVLQAGLADAGALAARLRPLTEHETASFESIALRLREPINTALTSLGREPLSRPGDPKYSLFLTPFFRSSGVTGMVNPFGLEAVVLPDLLPFERPFVLAHEWAHLAGHADEAEASAVGWLACMKSGPSEAYSASLFLIAESVAALPAEVRQDALGRLSEGVRTDLQAIEERMREQSPTVRRTSSRVYDEYLRANRVADGTASYGRALTLILSRPFRDALSGYTLAR